MIHDDVQYHPCNVVCNAIQTVPNVKYVIGYKKGITNADTLDYNISTYKQGRPVRYIIGTAGVQNCNL